jgi:hypothetical protein
LSIPSICLCVFPPVCLSICMFILSISVLISYYCVLFSPVSTFLSISMLSICLFMYFPLSVCSHLFRFDCLYFCVSVH